VRWSKPGQAGPPSEGINPIGRGPAPPRPRHQVRGPPPHHTSALLTGREVGECRYRDKTTHRLSGGSRGPTSRTAWVCMTVFVARSGKAVGEPAHGQKGSRAAFGVSWRWKVSSRGVVGNAAGRVGRPPGGFDHAVHHIGHKPASEVPKGGQLGGRARSARRETIAAPGGQAEKQVRRRVRGRAPGNWVFWGRAHRRG